MKKLTWKKGKSEFFHAPESHDTGNAPESRFTNAESRATYLTLDEK
jgi:hypothetical protein